jgi:hypothetical protein
MPKANEFESELVAWQNLRLPHQQKVRRQLCRRARRMFPGGRAYSLRSFVEVLLSPQKRHLLKNSYFKFVRDIHPHALELLLEYGHDYKPSIWRTRPPDDLQPKPGRCFRNTYLLMCAQNLRQERLWEAGSTISRPPSVYVEGLVVGAIVPPMLHAWNARGLNGVRAVDWSHYAACHWSRYLGIPFTAEEQKQLSMAAGLYPKFLPFFHKKHFSIFEPHVAELLWQRRLEARLFRAAQT